MIQSFSFQIFPKLLSPSLQSCGSIRNIKHKIKTTLPFEEYSLDDINQIEIDILKRKNGGKIQLIQDLINQLKSNAPNKEVLHSMLQQELKKLPNKTHPDVIDYGEEPHEKGFYNNKPTFSFQPKQFSEICKKNNLLRMEHLGNFTGTKTYYLMKDLAELVCNLY